jgi:hypothetical protein
MAVKINKMTTPNIKRPIQDRIFSAIGYADRSTLAGQLHQLQVNPEINHTLTNYLKDRNVLKGRFNPSSLGEIQPYMLKKVVTPTEVKGLFNDSEDALGNISDGLKAGWDTITLGTYDHESKLIPAFKIAIGIGTVAAAGIGATLLGLPAIAGFGTCLAYGMASEALYPKIKSPNSTAGKILDFGKRLFPIALGATLIDGAYMSSSAGEGMFVDAVRKFLGPKGLLYGVLTTLGITGVISALEIRRANNKRMSALKPLKKGTIRGNILLANYKIWGAFNYMSYRSLCYLAYGIGAGYYHFDSHSAPWLFGGSIALGIGWRIASHYMHLDKASGKIADKTIWALSLPSRINDIKKNVFHINNTQVVKYKKYRIGITGERTIDDAVMILITLSEKTKKNGKMVPTLKALNVVRGIKSANVDNLLKSLEEYVETDKEYREAGKCIADIKKKAAKVFFRARPKDHPIAKLALEYTAETIMKYGPFALSDALATDPVRFAFDFATLYFGGATILADAHSQLAATLSAYNYKRSTFNTEEPYISRADESKVTAICTRFCAYLNEYERSIVKLVDPLVMEYPHTSVIYSNDRDPYSSIKIVEEMHNAQKIMEQMEQLRGEVYGEFLKGYKNLKYSRSVKGKNLVKENAIKLAEILTKVGNLYFPSREDRNSYVARIMEIIAKNKKLYNLDGEEAYTREAYKIIKVRGFEFLKMAENFREMAEEGKVTYKELEAFYKEMLGNFSVDMHYSVRKAEWTDEKVPTKSLNQGAHDVHLGDTRYQVWRLEGSQKMNDEGTSEPDKEKEQ